MNANVKKTHLKAYLQYLRTTDLRLVTVYELSQGTGYKEDIVIEDISFYVPLVKFQPDLNLLNVLDELEEAYKNLKELKANEKAKTANKTPNEERVYIRKKDADSYTGVVDYVNRYMTFAGGMLDLGYTLTKKDIKILRKLLKKEEEKYK